nr:MAG TPA: DNA polymerase III, alpha subunit [Caudoviricetes sp.]
MVHLHLHTKYSLLDSTIKLEDLIDKLDELGMDTVAITDHGVMYGCCELYKMLKQHGKKLIIGCECYICENRFEAGQAYHLVLLAKNETGRLNLQKIVSDSTRHKYKGKPRIDLDLLTQYHEGLICLSACMAGEVTRALQANDTLLAKQIACKYKFLFGDDYYIEYQSHSDPEQQKYNAQLVQIAEELDIKYVVTCDCHYLTPADQKYHTIFIQINQKRDVGETYQDCYVQSEEDVLRICESTQQYNKQAIATTQEIADKCSAEYPLSAPIIPHNKVPAPYKSEISYMKKLCNEGYKAKGINKLPADVQKVYRDRAHYEMNAVAKMGFEGYYLLVDDYLAHSKRRGIARGSAGGSLLAYLMNIVDIDPIQYGLYFERFIDVGALDLLEAGTITKAELKIPDVDSDFGKLEREHIMQYITDKYGSNNIACLGIFGYLWAKGAIKDIGRVLGIPFEVTNEMTSCIENESIDEVIELGLLDKYKEKYPELLDYAQHIAGLPKSFGIHPCGRLISTQAVDYYNALEYSENADAWVLQGDMHTADDLGLVKVDFLGLRTVDVMYDVLEMIGKSYEDISPRNIDLNDPLVWNEFKQGNTELIFQFSSTGMRGILRDMQCDNMDDLGVANALYRPGALQYIPNYVRRKHGQEPVSYVNPDLGGILKPTYGIIVFQEQLIDIGRLAGLKNPDELRKATAKKKPALMAKIEPEMKQGLMQRGWTQGQVDKLWDDILDFARYSFNKAHAYAYALTAYISMYLKVHYPAECMTAYINSYKGSLTDIVIAITEAKRMGLTLKFDNWRNIQADTTCRDGVIYLGLTTLSGFGDSAAEQLRSIQADSFTDVLRQVNINKNLFEALITLGFFAEFGESGYLMGLWQAYQKVYSVKEVKKDKMVFPEELLKQCAKETAKKYRITDHEKLFALLCQDTKSSCLPVSQILTAQLKYQGYITYHDERLKGHYLVLDLSTKYSPKLKLYDLSTGEIQVVKTRTKTYQANPFNKGAIIRAPGIIQQPKSQLIDGKWRKMLDETEPWIMSYQIKGGVEIE